MSTLFITTALCVVLAIATAVLLVWVFVDRAIIDSLEADIMELECQVHDCNTILNTQAKKRRIAESKLTTEEQKSAQLARDNYAYAVKLADRLNEMNELKLRVSRLQKQQREQVNS